MKNRSAGATNFPSPLAAHPSCMSNEEKIEYISVRFREIMGALGLDLTDSSLEKTPYRVAKMYVEEVFSGLNAEFPSCTVMTDEFQHQGKSNMVFVKIPFHSFCEHHFVPMVGDAYIAYLPAKKLIGFSNISQIVRFFAARPQIQERLAAQIADSLSSILESKDVAISMKAQHFCMTVRGVENAGSYVITNVLRGKFDSDESTRQEYFESFKINN